MSFAPTGNKKTIVKNPTPKISPVATTATLATQVIQPKISGKADKTLVTAQQATALAGAVTGSNSFTQKPANPGGAIPFDQLDTPTATQVAMAGSKAGKNNDLVAAIGDMLAPKITANIYIGEKAITEVLSVSIYQSINGHNSLKLRFYQDQAQAPGSFTFEGAEKLLGQVTEVELYDKNGLSGGKLQNLFVIADVRFEQHALNEGIIEVTGYAPTWILDGEPHFETFYKKNLTTIAKSVAKSLPQVKASLKADPTITDTLPFVCRYNESAWNFLKRLSAETGQWLYFDGKQLVFGKTEAKQGPKIIYGHNCYNINMSLRAKPVQQKLFDYEADEDRTIQTAANNYNGNAGAYNLMAFSKSNELFGATPAVASPAFLPSKEDTLQAIGKSKGAQSVAGMYYITGETTIHELRVGLSSEIEFKRGGQSASHAPVRIINIEHHIDASGLYTNTFEAIPAAAEAPPAISYSKPITFPMLAQVIDNKDSKGRVRVKFLGWQQEGLPETDFIRVLTPDAGGGGDKVAQNRGLVTIPEIGDQVYVDFEQGNPDRPFVTGSVFHGKWGTGGGDANKTKSLATRSGNKLELNDADGSTYLTDQGGANMLFDGAGNATSNANKNYMVNAGSSNTINAGSSNTINVGGEEGAPPQSLLQMDADGNIVLDGKTNITFKVGENSITISADGINITATTGEVTLDAIAGDLAMSSGQTMDISATGDLNVTGGPNAVISSGNTNIM